MSNILCWKFAKKIRSRVLKSVGWEIMKVWHCRTSFWIPSMYMFKWCKYEDYTLNSCWEICFQTKKSLIFFQPQGKILKGIFETQFPNLLEILLKFYRKFYWTIYCVKYVVIVWIQKCRKNSVIFSRNILWFYQLRKTMKWSV